MKPTDHKRMVARNLMLAREALGMRQTDFAKRIGMTAQQLWNVESGRSYPPPVAIKRACEEFGFSADWFYRGIRAGTAGDVASSLIETERRLPNVA
jgi:transcriptional regulator with XRE-family HTH domain